MMNDRYAYDRWLEREPDESLCEDVPESEEQQEETMERRRAIRHALYGGIIHCEWWLESRRQCRRPATIEILDPGFEAPHRFCAQHARIWGQWDEQVRKDAS